MTGTTEEILSYFRQLAQESGAIEKQVFEICWYMRGGITLDQAWQLSYNQRSIVMDIIKDNVERTKESGLALL